MAVSLHTRGHLHDVQFSIDKDYEYRSSDDLREPEERRETGRVTYTLEVKPDASPAARAAVATLMKSVYHTLWALDTEGH